MADSAGPSKGLHHRHIQDHTIDAETESHWGYPDRQVPCLNDEGSCAYLDTAYAAHDRGMLYVGIIWLTIVAILLAWGTIRFLTRSQKNRRTGSASGIAKASASIATTARQYLLPDAARCAFGRTTRLQVGLLALLLCYIICFTFIGLVYNKWVTPVKDLPGVYNTRTTIGPWSNRIGVLAYALMPLSVLLSSRESLLSVITGISYQHFNFLHRWVGYIIFVQSALHTLGWCVVQLRLYQPQPKVAQTWIREVYILWGIAAMVLVLVMYLLTLPFVIKRTGYEFFQKSHYILAMIFLGACIAHWDKLHCFITPAIILWFMDRGTRFLRVYLIHRRSISSDRGLFHSAPASATVFASPEDGDVVRLDFEHPQTAWKVGQHFYITFTEGSIWQSHPFTPIQAPVALNGIMKHSYVFRAKTGETQKIKNALKAKADENKVPLSTPVILCGPYGTGLLDSHRTGDNVLCVAGGTGITYVLPVLLTLAGSGRGEREASGKIVLVWFIRRLSDVEWIRDELHLLQASLAECEVRVHVTREASSNVECDEGPKLIPSLTNNSRDDNTNHLQQSIQYVKNTTHPDVEPIVQGFVEETERGSTTIFASGPGAMMSDLRTATARLNSGFKVWRGQEKYNVSLRCDDRLEN